ncbi:MAG: hypothetical protein AB7O24_25670 [Kofleriaceae bacterium]
MVRRRDGAVAGAALALVLALPGSAAADKNDLVLNRLATRVTDGVVPQSHEFRALASQLGVALAPHLMTPADTLGFGGFQFTFDYSTTTIDSSASYWKALASSPDPEGDATGSHGSSMLSTLGFFVRKGMWFPMPSFELGAGAVHVLDSEMWTGQFYAKLALHEGYHQLPIPSIAARAAVSRLMTQRELDLTVVSVDATVSKHVGIGGTWRLDPFAGWNVLAIIPRSEVIDATPEIDPLTPGNQDDLNMNFVFSDQDLIYRHRLFFGAKLQYYVVQLTIEAQFALKGSSLDDRRGSNELCMPNSSTTICDAKDTAAGQRTISVSAGVDF